MTLHIKRIDDISSQMDVKKIEYPINRYFYSGMGLVDSVELVDIFYVLKPHVHQNEKQRAIISRIDTLVTNDARIDDAIALLPKIPNPNVVEEINLEEDVTESGDNDFLDLTVLEASPADSNELASLLVEFEMVVFYNITKGEVSEPNYYRIPLASFNAGFPDLGDVPEKSDLWFDIIRETFVENYDAALKHANVSGARLQSTMKQIAEYLAKNSSFAAGVGEMDDSDPVKAKADAARSQRVSEFLNAVTAIVDTPESFDTTLLGEDIDEDNTSAFTDNFEAFYDNLEIILNPNERDTLALAALDAEVKIRLHFEDMGATTTLELPDEEDTASEDDETGEDA